MVVEEIMGRVLAIDYGSKRVGLAVTDPLRIIAQPLETVAAKECLEYIERYLQSEQVDTVVIGMPVQPSGEPSDAQRFIRPFIGRFRKKFPEVELIEVDEIYSSKEAFEAMLEGGVKRAQRAQKSGIVDRTAAAIILQRYLETL